MVINMRVLIYGSKRACAVIELYQVGQLTTKPSPWLCHCMYMYRHATSESEVGYTAVPQDDSQVKHHLPIIVLHKHLKGIFVKV